MGARRWTDVRSRIDVRDSGDREASIVLVYLPGLGERGEVFDSVVSAEPLASFRHVVLDYVDWTQSTPPRETIALETVADRVAEHLAAQVSRPVVLVGHSMGGVVAQLLVERHPERVAKLVDIEGNLSRDDCTFSGKAVTYSIDAFIAHGFVERRSELSRSAERHTRRYAEGLDGCAPTTYYAYAAPLVRLSREETLAARLGTLPVPVLYIYGQDPQRGLSARSRAMLSRTSIQVEPIGHAGHWAYLDEPERFVRVLLAFIEG
jgi:pimeloyl-ACP methyl ester carboxylesterase